MSFFWKRPVRGRKATPLIARTRALRTPLATVFVLLALLLLVAACTTPVQNDAGTAPASSPTNTSPLAAATIAQVEGEPAITESDESEPTLEAAGEPVIETLAPNSTTPELPPDATIALTASSTSTVTATLSTTLSATFTPTVDLMAMLDLPVAAETNSPPSGALSGASATVTPVLTSTLSAGGSILARLAAINSAAATSEAAATSAPGDAPAIDETPTSPEMQPAPEIAPPATLPANASSEIVWDGVERTLNVPILMYHYLSDPPAGADAIRRDLSVSPQRFAEHLDRMLEEGYTTISFYALMDALYTGAPLPEKPVVITFDDGYRDNYENAFPLLRDRDMTATFFVVTDFIDEERPNYVSWDQVREMLAAGMSIESHGRNHATLEGRNDDYLVWQALGSLETLQFELGVRPRFVSYPAGDYDANTMRIFSSAGYLAGVTTNPGATQSSSEPFELPRVRVHSTTTANQLSVLLTMDWD